MSKKLRHKGVRPKHKLLQYDIRRDLWEERVTGRIWNRRLLNSGCGKIVKQVKFFGDIDYLIYCPHCDEYFNKEQWEGI